MTTHDLGNTPLRNQFDYELTSGWRTKRIETFTFDDDSDSLKIRISVTEADDANLKSTFKAS